MLFVVQIVFYVDIEMNINLEKKLILICPQQHIRHVFYMNRYNLSVGLRMSSPISLAISGILINKKFDKIASQGLLYGVQNNGPFQPLLGPLDQGERFFFNISKQSSIHQEIILMSRPYIFCLEPLPGQQAAELKQHSAFALLLSAKLIGKQIKICKNNFCGPPGYWPDLIYTQATEEAMRSDLLRLKYGLGFNLNRKHIKVCIYWSELLICELLFRVVVEMGSIFCSHSTRNTCILPKSVTANTKYVIQRSKSPIAC